MATITGLTAERMLEIEGASVVEGEIVGGDLILTKQDGTTINAGSVIGPPGPQGPVGPASVGAIPGEVKLWSGETLPVEASYGLWVWADGKDYANADHPLAAAHISPAWKTFAGASSPGASRFRVPDLRGLVPAGLDQMPTGSTVGRANRMTRAVAVTFAARTGKETHVLTVPEMARHKHGGSVSVSVTVGVSGSISGSTDTQGAHNHGSGGDDFARTQLTQGGATGTARSIISSATGVTTTGGAHAHSVGGSFSGSGSGSGSGTIADEGNDQGHETVQPTVMVPYIVFLDTV